MTIEEKPIQNRSTLLANVAEMYYLEDKDQSAIALEVGVTRSMVSRMLTEARNKGIVEIKVNHPINTDHELEEKIYSRFGINSNVVVINETTQDKLLAQLGRAAANLLNKNLRTNIVIGVAWGTTVSATVDAITYMGNYSPRVVQLVGAMGATNAEYDGHAIVQRLAVKLGGEGYYINAPYLCQSPEIAQSIRETKGVKETIEMGAALDVALLGVGTTITENSSYYLSGFLSREEMENIRINGAVGDVASNYFQIDGTPYQDAFTDRLIRIQLEDLMPVPLRIGVAGGQDKVHAIIGALNAKIINFLITDNLTARKLLE